jgi:hypothetical protein
MFAGAASEEDSAPGSGGKGIAVSTLSSSSAFSPFSLREKALSVVILSSQGDTKLERTPSWKDYKSIDIKRPKMNGK